MLFIFWESNNEKLGNEMLNDENWPSQWNGRKMHTILDSIDRVNRTDSTTNRNPCSYWHLTFVQCIVSTHIVYVRRRLRLSLNLRSKKWRIHTHRTVSTSLSSSSLPTPPPPPPSSSHCFDTKVLKIKQININQNEFRTPQNGHRGKWYCDIVFDRE